MWNKTTIIVNYYGYSGLPEFLEALSVYKSIMSSILIKAPFFLLVMVFLVICGCEEGTEPTPAREDRGVALESLVQSYALHLSIKINALKLELRNSRTIIKAYQFESENALNELTRVVTIYPEQIDAAGLMDDFGIVRNMYPDRGVIGENRSEREEVSLILHNDQEITLSDVYQREIGKEQDSFFDYLLPVHDGEVFRGIIWFTCNLNSIIETSLITPETEDSTKQTILLLEDNGLVIFDSGDLLRGCNLLDTLQFPEEICTLGERLIDKSTGHDLFNSNLIPGCTDSMTYIGWTYFNGYQEYWDNSYWVIALTEKAE